MVLQLEGEETAILNSLGLINVYRVTSNDHSILLQVRVKGFMMSNVTLSGNNLCAKKLLDDVSSTGILFRIRFGGVRSRGA